ncbi:MULTISPECIES: hypothetical protein [Achromobacter]|uniref:hypothetical protein n=1 Tax=Achromobacter TaxID=222 RepID=UPI00300D5C11
MANATKHPDTGESGRRRQPARPDQSPAESPDPPVREQDADRHGRWPPGGLPNPMPDVDPQQTPGIDRLGDAGPERRAWLRGWRAL